MITFTSTALTIVLIAIIWNLETFTRLVAGLRVWCRGQAFRRIDPPPPHVALMGCGKARGCGPFVCAICGEPATTHRGCNIRQEGGHSVRRIVDLCAACKEEAAEFSRLNHGGVSE